MKILTLPFSRRPNFPVLFLLSLTLMLIFGVIVSQISLELIYRGKILPGVIIGNMSVGGLPLAEAQNKIQTRVAELQTAGLTFCLTGKCLIIETTALAPNDPDLSYELAFVNTQQLLQTAYNQGRQGNIFQNLNDQWQLINGQIQLPLNWEVAEQQIINILAENFAEYENRAKNASLNIISPHGEPNSVTINHAQTGWRFDYETALTDATRALNNLETPIITVATKKEQPNIDQVDQPLLIAKARIILSQNVWNLNYQDNYWPLTKEDVASLLTLEKNDNLVTIGLEADKFNELLNQPREQLERPARDAKFKITANRVVEFQSSQDGLQINTTASWQKANELFHQATSSWQISFPLLTETTPASTPTGSVNNLGVREIIGIGISDFSGSPKNRIHNIKTGATALNGLLIPPGQEFSLITALGKIDGANGYLQELVIKGNKTIPEYGGGLCQIGTTTFRAALASGLPIIERQNHSYRVVYYEPAGTDATIYSPKPDFRFKNDTVSHILIQTRLEGTKLIFEFWGTQDGRLAEQTKPAIYNITDPPPTKYIETADLPIGEIKCTERAHKGADTSFTYKISYPNGEVKEETFNSHYRPWQEVCLIGVDPEKLKLDQEQKTDPTLEAEPVDVLSSSLN